jgi:segregation and condensation protein B
MNNLESKIESLLFISGRPMSARELAELVKSDSKEIEAAAEKLLAMKKESGSGTQILKNGSSFQMVTAPENAAMIQDFIKDETTGELSRPSLETLTIIAYRGPISKTDLDRIRGVNCSLILHNLLVRGLIDSKEDKKKMEIYYTATFDFLKFLGLNEVKELPDFERLNKDDTIDRILADGQDGAEKNNPHRNESESAEKTEEEEEFDEEEEDEDEGEKEEGEKDIEA